MYAIIENGIITSITSDAEHPCAENETLLPAPADLSAENASEWILQGGQLVRDPVRQLNNARALRIGQIKGQASASIDALGWRLERAREQDAMAIPGERVADILAAREAIRRASNRTEAAVLAAETLEEIAAITLEITDDDTVRPAAITREQFLARFTQEEIGAILTAAKANVALEAFVLRLTTASYISVCDAATQAGVQALEIAGLLSSGRAEQILALTE